MGEAERHGRARACIPAAVVHVARSTVAIDALAASARS